jgi:hypothetical protein
MAIDDPISALQSLNASDDRQGSPVSRFAKEFLGIVKLFAPPGAEIPLAGLEAVTEWLSARAEKNREELLDAVAEEIKHRGAQIEQLRATSEEHRRFMADEMPGLALDALRRAEQTRAKERIRRLGRILVHAAQVGPKDGADYAEEMLRIATELGERDILMLREVVCAEIMGPDQPINEQHRLNRANRVWEQVPWLRIGIGMEERESIAGKLQSFGLLSASSNISAVSNTYVVLPKARDFVKYVQRAAQITG